MTEVRTTPLRESLPVLGEQLPDSVVPTVALSVGDGTVVKSRPRSDGAVNVWVNGTRTAFDLSLPADFVGADVVIEGPRPVSSVELVEVLTDGARVDPPSWTLPSVLSSLCRWESDGLVLAVVDTGPHHRSAAAELAARADDCAKAAASLGLASLADAGLDATVRCDESLRPLVRHVVTERARVHRVRSVLERGDWAQFGQLLTASHESLRDDLAVSTPELDHTVAQALAAGALGARLTGPGFGGRVLALLPSPTARRLCLQTLSPGDGS